MTDSSEMASEQYATFRVLNLQSVLFDLSEPSPAIHFMEAESPFRYFTVPIALAEAVSLNNAMAGVVGRRPSSHELFTTILQRLQADVICARIVKQEQGIFFAELDLMTPKGRETFDCRVSDAVILTQRQKVPAPILCDEEILAR
jgi:bifunctional DNase/RNase